MHANGNKSTTIQSALHSLTALALAGAVGMIGLMRGVSELGPKVGDIVAFDPLAQLSRDMTAQIAVMRANGSARGSCTLDMRAMHAGGGSVVIEAMAPGVTRTYRVHWAGLRTHQHRHPPNPNRSEQHTNDAHHRRARSKDFEWQQRQVFLDRARVPHRH